MHHMKNDIYYGYWQICGSLQEIRDKIRCVFSHFFVGNNEKPLHE